MSLRIDYLTGVPFEKIASAFNTAFADYYLQMGDRAENWLRNRMIKNGVESECSVGVFDGSELVGFSLTGIDIREGELAAFDAATGIVPEFRGRGLARQMFDFALPRLRERKVRSFLLEVLQVNEPAIRAYRKTGFSITREFDCFERQAGAHGDREWSGDHSIVNLDKERLVHLADHFDWTPSWENSITSISRIPDELLSFGAFDGNDLIGTLAYYPLLQWIVNLAVRRDRRREGIASSLLSHLAKHLPEGTGKIKLINVMHEDHRFRAALERNGFNQFVSQYEMKMELT